jgi:hypothetical protein
VVIDGYSGIENIEKKCVAYPQEDFLFTILTPEGHQKVYLRATAWEICNSKIVTRQSNLSVHACSCPAFAPFYPTTKYYFFEEIVRALSTRHAAMERCFLTVSNQGVPFK